VTNKQTVPWLPAGFRIIKQYLVVLIQDRDVNAVLCQIQRDYVTMSHCVDPCLLVSSNKDKPTSVKEEASAHPLMDTGWRLCTRGRGHDGKGTYIRVSLDV